ncbi:protein-glutamate methylesterase/protein-glutamine glutaminase [Pseudomarimonas arenosa]|uniref:Protein-glutamate methylesterase/protein-glutamine glutaminase n=1 Tax=Pseudomarimonas arenosa TaxID=2774145 RepID=A0AAW3ZQK3_9GAMM|nr:chemotaxis response regulator protein-glutamate methylesterase [Pseudomarimonas arenosa]MBD8527200.1 chemotaxis response regulator protein-glutamate methylesterase [Pseudomarimonas arenosa]
MRPTEIKVMIIDDSAVVRQVLGAMINQAPGMRLLATASDPIAAQPKLSLEWPDVIVLDVEMPRMDGVTFLRQLMGEHPTPVVICSTLTEHGTATSLEAMAAGAVDVITKPRLGLKDFLAEQASCLLQSIRQAARSRPRLLRPSRPPPAVSAPQALPKTTDKVIAIGTSTGGTQALELVLTGLPRVVPGMVVVQHMPERFTAAFAARLDSLCAVEVKEAEHGDRVLPGRVLIAPGGRHMRLARSGALYRVEISDGPTVNRHKPSVDVLFRSVAQAAGPNATGILMTGMGDDGARGLKEMQAQGAYTIAQNEASCVVFGMPREAIRLQAVNEVLPLDQIAPAIGRIAL